MIRWLHREYRMEKEERYLRRDGAIHKEFGLTYASFLVLPRTFLMDMPTKWQDEFVALIRQYNDSVEDLSPDYEYEISVTFRQYGKFKKIPEMYSNYRHPKHMDMFNVNCFADKYKEN